MQVGHHASRSSRKYVIIQVCHYAIMSSSKYVITQVCHQASMSLKDFSSWPFLCVCVLCDTHARLLFERASEQESCLFLLIRPGKVLPGNAAFIETVSYPSQMLSDSLLILTCVLSILSPRLSPIYSVCDTDLSYHHLPYLKVRVTSVAD